ncbi:hypothetical protein [Deinococcus sp.]|uniref:hypothetical protein n=1 Tax=Deinococcus sp. TaxID=47478 RepID=UPI003CC517BC
METGEGFREHVERLVAEGKLSTDEAQELLAPGELEARQMTDPQPGWVELDAGELPTVGIPADLHLKIDGYGLQVVFDPGLARPRLSANRGGELRLWAGPEGWTVERTGGPRSRTWGLKAVLSLPFVPDAVRAEVNGGNLTLPDVMGEVRLSVSGGNTRLGRAAGLKAEISGGNLSSGEISGGASVRISGGNARLDGAAGVQATVNGGNFNWSGRLLGGEHRIEVNAGNATLHLLEGSSVTVQADVTLGGLMASFPLTKTGGMMQAHYSGTLGSGAAHLGCTVNAGQIRMVSA